jgi:hypothetical protein
MTASSEGERMASAGGSAPSFSIAAIRHHIRQRLTFAKETCDKELRKISGGIIAHVEQDIQLSRTLSHEEGARNPAAPASARHGGDVSSWSASASALTSDAEGPDSDATGDEITKVRPPLGAVASVDHICRPTSGPAASLAGLAAAVHRLASPPQPTSRAVLPWQRTAVDVLQKAPFRHAESPPALTDAILPKASFAPQN